MRPSVTFPRRIRLTSYPAAPKGASDCRKLNKNQKKTMKLTKTILVATLVVGGLLAGSTGVFAQGGRGGVLTPEQMTQMTTAMQGAPEMAALTAKLTEAQKAAVDAALAADATEAGVRAKVEAVGKIQTDIAMLRYSKGVKPIVASITADQKTQIDAAPGATYGQFFGGAGGRGGGGRRGGGQGAPPAQ
jgi:hypothetical protein